MGYVYTDIPFTIGGRSREITSHASLTMALNGQSHQLGDTMTADKQSVTQNGVKEHAATTTAAATTTILLVV